MPVCSVKDTEVEAGVLQALWLKDIKHIEIHLATASLWLNSVLCVLSFFSLEVMVLFLISATLYKVYVKREKM